MLEKLPRELALYTLSFFSSQELKLVPNVSKNWQALHSEYWQEKVKKEFQLTLPLNINAKEYYSKILSNWKHIQLYLTVVKAKKRIQLELQDDLDKNLLWSWLQYQIVVKVQWEMLPTNLKQYPETIDLSKTLKKIQTIYQLPTKEQLDFKTKVFELLDAAMKLNALEIVNLIFNEINGIHSFFSPAQIALLSLNVIYTPKILEILTPHLFLNLISSKTIRGFHLQTTPLYFCIIRMLEVDDELVLLSEEIEKDERHPLIKIKEIVKILLKAGANPDLIGCSRTPSEVSQSNQTTPPLSIREFCGKLAHNPEFEKQTVIQDILKLIINAPALSLQEIEKTEESSSKRLKM